MRPGGTPAVAPALLLLLALATRAGAAEVRLPLSIDYLTLRETLKSQIFTGPGERADLWRGLDPCQFLHAEKPRLKSATSAVEIESDASLSLGVGVAGKCLTPIAWQGIIGLSAQPYVTPDLKLKLRVTDVNLYNPEHEKTLLVGHGFDLVKQYFIPRIETFTFDLRPPLDELGALAEAASPPDVAARVRQALASVSSVPPLELVEDGVRVTLALELPERTAPTPAPPGTPVAPLNEAELAAWTQSLDEWDAFLVFAIKQLGLTTNDPQIRDDLLNLLLDSRFRLVQALTIPPATPGPDPVRLLFLQTWSRLGGIVRAAAHRGELGGRALEFLSFVSAGDALLALDQAAPALGMRISADDLRRLARIMAPNVTGDPLRFNFNEDTELQKVFGIVPPPTTPGSLEPNAPAPLAVPPTPAPQASPPAAPHAYWLWWWGPDDAFAAEDDALSGELWSLGRRLRRAVVDHDNAVQYRGELGHLLSLSARRALELDDPGPRYHHFYLTLVQSTAWQESCWRQFVQSRGRVRYLESASGDIGLMQVNKYVWRGFYSIAHLEWDIVYNASAGAEILMRLMKRAPGAGRGGGNEDLGAVARSTYSAYNGGPGAYRRWLKPDAPIHAQLIDTSFWIKFQAVERGDQIDILTCAAQWGGNPGR